LDNGELSGGTVTVDPEVGCVDGTITFTAAGVVDSVWIKRVLCTAKQPVEPPARQWVIRMPSDGPCPGGIVNRNVFFEENYGCGNDCILGVAFKDSCLTGSCSGPIIAGPFPIGPIGTKRACGCAP